MKKLVPIASAIAGMILLARAVTPAFAAPADCEAIVNAYNAVAAVPGFKQSISMTEPKTEMVQMVIGETIYAQIDGEWTKMKLKPGGRKGILDAVMSASTISGCKEIRAENLPSGRAKVYEFMMTPPKGLPGAGSQPIRQEVWIGAADGLVHRFVTSNIVGNLTYGTLIPPIP